MLKIKVSSEELIFITLAVVGSSLTFSCLSVRRTVRYAPVRTTKDTTHLCSVLYSKTCYPYSRDGWIRPLQWFVVLTNRRKAVSELPTTADAVPLPFLLKQKWDDRLRFILFFLRS